jgi:alkyldihydroxyacetonephosphate synthase
MWVERMWRLKDLDEKSLLATFGCGVRGPWLEAQLRWFGYTLGHYSQSFEYSTLGGSHGHPKQVLTKPR